MARHTIWTKDAVEALWAELATQRHLRARGGVGKFWALVTSNINQQLGINSTPKGVTQIAAKVRKAGRPYPWETSVPTPRATTKPRTAPRAPRPTGAPQDDSLLTVLGRLDRIEAMLTDRIMPTPDIRPAVGQVWVSRDKLAQTSNEHSIMRVTAVTDDEVTMSTIDSSFIYTLTMRSFAMHFAHVGFAQQGAQPPVVTPVTGTKPAVVPTSNGHRDLGAMLD